MNRTNNTTPDVITTAPSSYGTEPGAAMIADFPGDYAQALYDLVGHQSFRFTIGLRDGRLYAVSHATAEVFRLGIEIRNGSPWPTWTITDI